MIKAKIFFIHSKVKWSYWIPNDVFKNIRSKCERLQAYSIIHTVNPFIQNVKVLISDKHLKSSIKPLKVCLNSSLHDFIINIALL